MIRIFKKIKIPETPNTKEVDSLVIWKVRWTSRKGTSQRHLEFTDCLPEMEAFTSKELAEEFATDLKRAFTLLKYTGYGTEITIEQE